MYFASNKKVATLPFLHQQFGTPPSDSIFGRSYLPPFNKAGGGGSNFVYMVYITSSFIYNVFIYANPLLKCNCVCHLALHIYLLIPFPFGKDLSIIVPGI